MSIIFSLQISIFIIEYEISKCSYCMYSGQWTQVPRLGLTGVSGSETDQEKKRKLCGQGEESSLRRSTNLIWKMHINHKPQGGNKHEA